jgi:hypothetical protein
VSRWSSWHRITNGTATRAEFLKVVTGTPDLKRVEKKIFWSLVHRFHEPSPCHR